MLLYLQFAEIGLYFSMYYYYYTTILNCMNKQIIRDAVIHF